VPLCLRPRFRPVARGPKEVAYITWYNRKTKRSLFPPRGERTRRSEAGAAAARSTPVAGSRARATAPAGCCAVSEAGLCGTVWWVTGAAPYAYMIVHVLGS
jgi:hypothetical protein